MTIDLIKPLTDKPENQLLIYAVGGSQSYGLATPTSDWDYTGIYMADPKNNFVGGYGKEDTQAFRFDEGQFEGSLHEYSQYIKLLSKCNPNVMDVLHCDIRNVEYITNIGIYLRKVAPKFLSLQAYHTFKGFGFSQYKQFNELGKPKQAMHLIRVMRMGVEILTDGVVNVTRKDAEELQAIRNGEWSYQQIVDEFHRLDERLIQAHDNSHLPETLNPEFVKQVNTTVWEMYHDART